MTEESIKELIDTNYRLLLLLGYSTALVMDYKNLNTYHDNESKCNWFMQAVNNVVYLKKPLPEFI